MTQPNVTNGQALQSLNCTVGKGVQLFSPFPKTFFCAYLPWAHLSLTTSLMYVSFPPFPLLYSRDDPCEVTACIKLDPFSLWMKCRDHTITENKNNLEVNTVFFEL